MQPLLAQAQADTEDQMNRISQDKVGGTVSGLFVNSCFFMFLEASIHPNMLSNPQIVAEETRKVVVHEEELARAKAEETQVGWGS